MQSLPFTAVRKSLLFAWNSTIDGTMREKKKIETSEWKMVKDETQRLERQSLIVNIRYRMRSTQSRQNWKYKEDEKSR